MRALAPGLFLVLTACSLRDLEDLTAGNGAPECFAPTEDPDVRQELPRQYLDTSYPDEAGLRVVHVATAEDLQAALDAAHGGELILLEPGVTYGPVTFGGGGDAWTIVRTDTSALPAPGTRPGSSVKLARIVGADGAPALRAVENARQLRVTGVELTASSGAVAELGPADVDPAHLPRNVVLDRVRISGGEVCASLNGSFVAVVDSTLEGCGRGFELPAGGGPYRISGVEVVTASGAAIAAGGTGRPADLEVAKSHLVRKASGTDLGVVIFGDVDRVLFACNVIDPSSSAAFYFADSARDVTLAENSARGVQTMRNDGTSERVVIQEDLFQDVTDMFRIDGTMHTSKIDHVTVLDWDQQISTALEVNEPTSPFWITNGIFSSTMYGIHGTGLGVGQSTIDADLAPGKVLGNALVGQSCNAYPTGNLCPDTVQSLGLESRSDPTLRGDSALAGTGTDGSNPGADVARLDQLIKGVAP